MESQYIQRRVFEENIYYFGNDDDRLRWRHLGNGEPGYSRDS